MAEVSWDGGHTDGNTTRYDAEEGGYRYHKWIWRTGDGSTTWAADTTSVEYLVVAGGGGPGGSPPSGYQHGSGGAGGYRTGTLSVSGTVNIVVGAGGNPGTGGASPTSGSQGGASSFSSISTTGGGYGAFGSADGVPYAKNGGNGGSGGGAPQSQPTQTTGGTGVSGEGYAGGNGAVGDAGAGGGSAGAASGATPGAGTSNSITGAAVTYARGGYKSGGATVENRGDGGNAIAATGAGESGYKGSDGIVVIKYQVPPAAPTNVTATDGTYTDKVKVTWTKSSGATGYQVYEGSNLLGTLGDVATYDDTAAPAPTITPGTASATDGTYTDKVVLSLSGASTSNGSSRTYKVKATNDVGDSSDSNTDTGYRGVGSLTYQWQRSAGDSDASYSNISGATTTPYNDTGGSRDGRYYKCILNATGASQQTSTANRGYLAVACAVTTKLPTEIAAKTATSNCTIDDAGTPAATVRGVCYSIAANPTTSSSKVQETGTFSAGNYTESLTGLIPNTLYHIRAFATNSVGTSYGLDLTFITFIIPPWPQDIELIIFDEDMDPVGRIKNAESFTFVENWYGCHTFELKIDAKKIDTYQLLTEIKKGGHIGFLDDDGIVKICIIENIEKPKGRTTEQWLITGRGVLSLLERRKLLNGYSTSTGFDAVTATKYSTAMRHYVDVNAITAKGPAGTTDANRVITGLSLEAADIASNGSASADCEFQGRAQSLLDTLVEFEKTSQLNCDLAWIGAAEDPGDRYLFEFRVKAGTDLSASVVLNMDLGNVLGLTYKESILGYRNCVYVAGAGDAAARALSTIYTGLEPTGRDRFEDYIDATDCSTSDQLTQRGEETLAAKKVTESLEFEFDTDNQSEVYGTDFVGGDIVTVRDSYYDVEMVDRIISVTSEWTEKGKKITLGMGTEPPDLVSILKMDRKQNTGVRR